MTTIKKVSKTSKVVKARKTVDTPSTSPNKNKDLIQYIWKKRGGRKQKAGILYATKKEQLLGPIVKIGWSKVALSKGDTFILKKGLKMAIDRSNAVVNPPPVPKSIKIDYNLFVDRCRRYYKNCLV